MNRRIPSSRIEAEQPTHARVRPDADIRKSAREASMVVSESASSDREMGYLGVG